MAKIIEFYIPISFRSDNKAKKIANQKGGQVIEFVPCPKKSA
jgi:nitrous oxide reductase accessory protein NosL